MCKLFIDYPIKDLADVVTVSKHLKCYAKEQCNMDGFKLVANVEIYYANHVCQTK